MAQDTETNPCHTDGEAHEHALTLRRVIDATPEKIWKAWMTPEILQQWFVPRPWTLSDVRIDPRPGGVFNFVMHGPDGETMPNSGIFLHVEPGKRWITTDALTPDWKTRRTAVHGGDCGTDPDRRRQDGVRRDRPALERRDDETARGHGLPRRLGNLRRPAG